MEAPNIGPLDTTKHGRSLLAQADVAEFTWDMKQRVEPHKTVLFKVTP